MPSFFATTSKGMERLLAAELALLASAPSEIIERRGGVAFQGELDVGYRACLWSRTASRVLMPLATFRAEEDAQLYEGVRSIAWADHLAPGRTLAVDFVTSRSVIAHSHFGALRVKDAIVDQLREGRGERPSIDTARPDVRVNVHLHEDTATVAIDLAGESLHRRGWRDEGVEAPLKENLGAAILLAAGWPALAEAGAPLVDPMCGSGTLPIEAAMIAIRRAPGIARERFGFLGWAGHQPEIWRALVEEARAGEVRDRKLVPPILGFDEDPKAVRVARGNVQRAGVQAFVTIDQRALAQSVAPERKPTPPDDSTVVEQGDRETGRAEFLGEEPAQETPCLPVSLFKTSSTGIASRGLFVVNPPYGERLGDEENLAPLYEQIGDVLRRRFPGWLGAVFTGSQPLAKSIGLRPSARHAFWNGPIECRLLMLPISAAPVRVEAPGWRLARERPSEAAAAFQNRVEKNLRHLRKWARREDVHCFRVYDADLVEYAFAVDLYEDAAHVQEYQPPKTVDPLKAEIRRRDAQLVLPAALGIAPESVFFKTRRRRRPGEQYDKLADEGHFRLVREGGHRFRVNLTDYLDTGLFLDHRDVRALIQREAEGRDFLNLFCYTATATVYAAAGGARTTTSVDLSKTYLDWGRRNLEGNGFTTTAHRLVHEDVLAWLETERRRFGLIFAAPPTFSNSKRMEGDFDVQRDHVALLGELGRLLTEDGVLLFSAPLRRFRMDAGALPDLSIEDYSSRTLPEDFSRSAREHHVFRVTRR